MAYVHKSGADKRRNKKEESYKLKATLERIQEITVIFLHTGNAHMTMEAIASIECAACSSDCTKIETAESEVLSSRETATDLAIISGEGSHGDVVNEPPWSQNGPNPDKAEIILLSEID